LTLASTLALASRFAAANGENAAPATPTAAPNEVVDRRELIVPTPGAELLRIDNPLGRIEVRAWDRDGEIHIIAEKHAATQEALDRLRVHYTAWQSGEISVDTRVELGGRERSLPLSGSRAGRSPRGRSLPWPRLPGAEAALPDLAAPLVKASLSLRTTGASIVEDAERTNSPISSSLAMTALLSTPNSFASS